MRFLSVFLVAFTFAGEALAAEVYTCVLTPHTRYGWISTRLVLTLDAANQSAHIDDDFIAQIYGKPIAGTLRRRDAASFQIDWQVEGMKSSNFRQSLSARYSAILRTDTGRITLKVYPTGWSSLPHGSGSCVKA